ncbi:HTH-type transcriptional repressor CarH [Tepidimonas sediminis]|uniref:HTH-type transcriptional repressor CarH n=1 Tax=Tepidimonas sediminis TaxID=2588941 RepID=A0A554WS75_9BURK|nr:cobalamin B12-binding domain-containing protein [Tepidimonas sediminis]TSE26426.1 HTH-type transcriptional repressor CarH [Tepidimonas sediminis]
MTDATTPSETVDGALWTIADVERDTGIGKDTLRVWERRYGFPRPRRDGHGDRLYDAAQLARLRLIRRLMDAGLRPGRIVGLPPAQLEALAQQLSAPAAAPLAAGGADDAVARALAWLREDRVEALRAELRAALRRLGLAPTIDALVAPLAVEVGLAWQRGELLVYQEHLFTETVQGVLREALAAAEPAADARPCVLLTTTPGETHQLGLLMAQCHLAEAGARCVALGPATPLADIVEAARRTAVDVVGLSYSAWSAPRDVLEAVQRLRAALPPAVALWVGGAGAQRPLRRVRLPGVTLLARAADVGAAVRRWRAAQAPGGASGSSAP